VCGEYDLHLHLLGQSLQYLAFVPHRRCRLPVVLKVVYHLMRGARDGHMHISHMYMHMLCMYMTCTWHVHGACTCACTCHVHVHVHAMYMCMYMCMYMDMSSKPWGLLTNAGPVQALDSAHLRAHAPTDAPDAQDSLHALKPLLVQLDFVAVLHDVHDHEEDGRLPC
jgi:hypothetical protein